MLKGIANTERVKFILNVENPKYWQRELDKAMADKKPEEVIKEIAAKLSETSDASYVPTVFWLKNITQDDKLKIWGDLKDSEGVVDEMKAAAKSEAIFIAGIASIENLGDNSEKIEAISKAVFNRFNWKEQQEIVGAISTFNFQGNLEIKN